MSTLILFSNSIIRLFILYGIVNNMPTEVTMDVPDNAWASLARNDMDCGHCIAELVDNAIAAMPESFRVQCHIEQHPDNPRLRILHMIDYSGGMTFETLKEAVLLGGSVGTNQLNEHGYGMKNALCTLTDKNRLNWILWTRLDDEISSVSGPFQNPMNVMSTADGDAIDFPELDFAHWGNEFNTYIKVEVKDTFINTLKGRGKNATNTNILKFYLMEDLAIKYRYYLREGAGNPNGSILVSYLDNRHFLKPLELPCAPDTREFTVIVMDSNNIEHEVTVTYNWGAVNEVRRETALSFYDQNGAVSTRKPVANYQGNQPSQGFDVIIGNRTILTRYFEDVWESGVDDDGEMTYMVRHPSHNDYLGEMRIANPPPNVFSTVNNKRGIDPDDENWQKIIDAFRQIDDCKPAAGGERAKSEKHYQNKLKVVLDATVPAGSTVSKERSVWPTGTRIDMYRKVGNDIRIYELKVKDADALAVYQTMMYWDGLADLGADEVPTEAWLAAPGEAPSLQELVDKINLLEDKHGNNYNIILKHIGDIGIEYP
jgi:hypothetical protein